MWWNVYFSASVCKVQRVQKKVSDSLELELQAVVSHQYRCWELKVGPLQDQHVLPI